MTKNPNLYEINTRVWLQKFDTDNKKAKLDNIPPAYWDDLKNKGIDIIWLMGIWQTCPSTIQEYCFTDSLVREYKSALKNFRHEDVIGSPFAIDLYKVNPEIGDESSLLKLKNALNERGLQLMLDFIPNHFSADTFLLQSHPEIFLEADEHYYKSDSHTFYKPHNTGGRIFAHGRDPFFPAWQDTVQVNYFSNAAREYMAKVLLKLADLCDGVRCDMAMLPLNNVFKNTWGNVLSAMGYEKPEREFWQESLQVLKDYRSDFVFLAEAYWDLEWELQQLGFDYTYDKTLTDRLKSGYVSAVKDHLNAEDEYQEKSARFIENHDEMRSKKLFGKNKVKAAAVIMSTIKGMHIFYDGQFEGKQIKLPVQLKREPVEPVSSCIKTFYKQLLNTINIDVFKLGEWTLLEPYEAWEGNNSYNNFLAWQWHLSGQKRLVVVNYSGTTSQCRIKLDVKGYPEEIMIKDNLNNVKYIRSAEEILRNGLFIELKKFQSHIFTY